MQDGLHGGVPLVGGGQDDGQGDHSQRDSILRKSDELLQQAMCVPCDCCSHCCCGVLMCEQVCKNVVLTLHCGVGSVSLSGSVRPPTCLSVCLSVCLCGMPG